MKKLTVAVVFGSRSTEHDVSIITALSAIIKPLKLASNFNVVPVYIDKKGRWFSDERLDDVKLFSSGKIDGYLNTAKPIEISISEGLTLIKPGIKRKLINIDVVFPATHGTHGEDGELMGLLQMADVPFVGCDMKSSVVAMDKIMAKQLVSSRKIKTSKMEFTTKADYQKDAESFINDVIKNLTFPLFVKPASLGSSIGITRVIDRNSLEQAVEVALHYDDKVLVEEEVANLIEVTLPIMGNDEPRPALLERPLTSSQDFFDFDTKYMKGGKKGGTKTGTNSAQGYSELPAKLDRELYIKAEKLGLEVYKALGCNGTARVDMLIDEKSKEVYFNEVNPLPGDLYAHNWRAAGVSSVDLVSELIKFAQERYNSKKLQATTFDTNFLKQF